MSESRQQILWPGWETRRLIGRGSFGEVYEIERDLFGKKEKAALKYISIPQSDGDIEELYSNGYDDASITAHFKGYLADIVREYSLMADLKGHPNVVYCDDIRYIQHDDGFGWDVFIKMELLRPLLKTLDKTTSEEQVVKLGKDICNALVLCKDKGIVHRDIKPQNIFVSETGDYKLGDFGIAKMVERTTGGTKIGTYSYMAPEVYNNQPYGSASDIYSLGLVMYWLLNERRLPFLPLPPKTPTVAETDAARAARFSGAAIPAPKNGSEKLKAIVLKACAFDPKDRYASATEMLDALNSLQEKQPIFAPISAASPEPTPVQQLVSQPEPETALQSVPQPELAPVPQAETVFETKSESAPTPIPAPDLVEKTTSHTNKHKKIGWWTIFILIALAVLMIVCMTRCNSGEERVITGISVSQLPKQQEYCVGETLNVDGLVIKVEYSDGTTEQVTSGFYCPTTKFSTTGGHSVHVYYLGHHTSFDVYVEDIAHTHNWMPADCDTPKTCIECGATTGNVGHAWVELNQQTVNAVHILCIELPIDTDSANSQKEAEDEAARIIRLFSEGEMTESAFRELCEQDSSIPACCEHFVFEGQENIASWCYSKDRKYGDYAEIQTSNKHHVVFFVEKAYWQIEDDNPRYCSKCFKVSGEIRKEDFFSALSGTGVAGYPAGCKVCYQYYNGCHFYADDNVLYMLDESKNSGCEIFRAAGNISNICVIDGYIFFNENTGNGYRIAAITIDGSEYREVLNNAYDCFYLDGWIYTRTTRWGQYVVRIRPGDGDSYQVISQGRILACDIDHQYLWIQEAEKIEKINLQTLKTECRIDVFSSVDHGYAKNGCLYVKASLPGDGWGLYKIEGDSVSSRLLADFSNFTIVDDKLVCTRGNAFWITDLNCNLDNLYNNVGVSCTVALNANTQYTSIIPAYGSCIAYVCGGGGLHTLDLETTWVHTFVGCSCSG